MRYAMLLLSTILLAFPSNSRACDELERVVESYQELMRTTCASSTSKEERDSLGLGMVGKLLVFKLGQHADFSIYANKILEDIEGAQAEASEEFRQIDNEGIRSCMVTIFPNVAELIRERCSLPPPPPPPPPCLGGDSACPTSTCQAAVAAHDGRAGTYHIERAGQTRQVYCDSGGWAVIFGRSNPIDQCGLVGSTTGVKGRCSEAGLEMTAVDSSRSSDELCGIPPGDNNAGYCSVLHPFWSTVDFGKHEIDFRMEGTWRGDGNGESYIIKPTGTVWRLDRDPYKITPQQSTANPRPSSLAVAVYAGNASKTKKKNQQSLTLTELRVRMGESPSP